MTEQSKINQDGAKRTSLLERADRVFGLDNLGPAKVPSNLPKPRVPAPRPAPVAAQPAAVPAAAPQPTAAAVPTAYAAPQPQAEPTPEPEPAVALSGPYMEIDSEHLRDAGLIVPEDPVTALLEEFRIVKRDIIADARAGGDPKQRRILVCSPHQGEGKTYCATNLAIALAAERDVEVLLVDADVIRPSVARRLGISAERGLMDALANPSLRPEKLAVRTDIEGLFVLPAGTTGSHDAEYLASERTGEILDRLTRGAPNRYVIFDTPPALASSAAAELASHVGQSVLVVRADETSRAALEDAHQLLSACPTIKLLLNAAHFSPSGRRFGEYGGQEE
ncbi:capsular biosynthesis protein [Erythrobacter insulae]|uniref:non-specific protein-tyrosine kinase n=1 Tax=Erythrobacter insulae TaxID=2584124 RepID=A0A547PED9_9SPHN|nr:AAA family ATPase [Erythrobacter insulae]TRD12513.1 capsular biosynthesis protein [Erythrobacter insulae]